MLKLKIEDGKIKGEISIKDLIFLFNRNPENFDGEKTFAKVVKGKEIDFAKAIITQLKEPSKNERDCVRWAEPIEDIFNDFLENDEDFLKYSNN